MTLTEHLAEQTAAILARYNQALAEYSFVKPGATVYLYTDALDFRYHKYKGQPLTVESISFDEYDRYSPTVSFVGVSTLCGNPAFFTIYRVRESANLQPVKDN